MVRNNAEGNSLEHVWDLSWKELGIRFLHRFGFVPGVTALLGIIDARPSEAPDQSAYQQYVDGPLKDC